MTRNHTPFVVEQYETAAKAIALAVLLAAGCVSTRAAAQRTHASSGQQDTPTIILDPSALDPSIPTPASIIGHDIGDGGRPPTRCIYKIEEPDPLAPPTGPIEYLEKYEFPYPGGKPFDMESLFARDGHLYVLAKSGWAATMYRAEVGGDGPAQLKRVTSLPVFLATGADVSADGRRLVVGSCFGLWVFPIDESDQFVDRSAVKCVGYQTSSRVEGCCFSGDDVILVGEDGLLFRVTADDIAAQAQLTIR